MVDVFNCFCLRKKQNATFNLFKVLVELRSDRERLFNANDTPE